MQIITRPPHYFALQTQQVHHYFWLKKKKRKIWMIISRFVTGPFCSKDYQMFSVVFTTAKTHLWFKCNPCKAHLHLSLPTDVECILSYNSPSVSLKDIQICLNRPTSVVHNPFSTGDAELHPSRHCEVQKQTHKRPLSADSAHVSILAALTTKTTSFWVLIKPACVTMISSNNTFVLSKSPFIGLRCIIN